MKFVKSDFSNTLIHRDSPLLSREEIEACRCSLFEHRTYELVRNVDMEKLRASFVQLHQAQTQLGAFN